MYVHSVLLSTYRYVPKQTVQLFLLRRIHFCFSFVTASSLAVLFLFLGFLRNRVRQVRINGPRIVFLGILILKL